MVDISAPDEVTADLAFAIPGRRDAGRLLAEWAARWTMVTSFDDDPPSYRFHSLLRDTCVLRLTDATCRASAGYTV